MTRTQFNDRAPDLRPRIDFRFVAYQEAPLIPVKPTNQQQREIAKKASTFLPVSTTEQRRRGRPPKVEAAPAPKPEKKAAAPKQRARKPPKATRPMTVKERRAEWAAKKVREVFASGPRTSAEVQQLMGQKERRYANRLLRSWSRQGLAKKISVSMDGRTHTWAAA